MVQLSTEFSVLADERYETILNDGKVLAWDDVREYLRKRVQGVTEQPPLLYKQLKLMQI